MSLRWLLGLMAIAISISACKPKDDDGNPDGNNFDRGPMLVNMADSVIIPGYEALQTQANSLGNAAEAFQTAPSAANLTALRVALGRAWFAWQGVSMFEIGPAMTQSIRANVGTFPPNAGTIETNISNGTWNLATANNLAAKGFPALDYLLFHTDSTQILAELSATDSAGIRRRQYVADVATEIRTLATATLQGWDAYRTQFVTSTGTDVGSSAGMFFNDYVFDFEILRRNKIGDCIGIRYLNTIRPEQVEAYYSRWSQALAIANAQAHLRAFRGQSVGGTNGLGLDDWLNTLNAQGSTGLLADEVAATMQAGITKLTNLPADLSTACNTYTQDVRAVYDDFQRCVVLFKADVSSALGILITYQDNDGD